MEMRTEHHTLHPLMLAGTGSDVGKSVLATAFCRIFRQDGYAPAPFKAQNMALNSFATPDGLEIGRAQAVQAEAAGLAPASDMNPLLLKPCGHHTSQIVLNGRPAGNTEAYDYFRVSPRREQLRREVEAAYDRLSQRYNPIVLEGAGSVSELNLRDTDLANMSMAMHAGADVLLVGDIDRGGVFASVYGSIMLQRPAERERIRGIIINKFRGDLRLFDDGRRLLEELCGVPVLGVVPYFDHIHIEEEDSVALSKKNRVPVPGRINIGVTLLPHLSNYTDFNALEHHPDLHLYFTDRASDLLAADVVVVPGSKSVISDLGWLRESGLAEAIVQARAAGKVVLGICGGYQMLGQTIQDPAHEESPTTEARGLGLLPVSTVLTGTKRSRQSHGLTTTGQAVSGYEIHQGVTTLEADVPSLFVLDDGTRDGCRQDDRCMGTYLHGVFDNPWFVRQLLAPLGLVVREFDYKAFRESQFDQLAAHVRKHVDMEKLYTILGAQ